jgi:branched-chain amino acid aminotransferase
MVNSFIQANTDGRLHDAAEPSISPLNRGFLYGDAVYEVWRTHAGVVFAFDEHWQRLGHSAQALYLNLGLSRERLCSEMQRTARAFREQTGERGELYVRLQVTRGAGRIGLDVSLATAPSWVLLVQALSRPALPAGRAGLRLQVAQGLRRNPVDALNPAWKTGNYLNNLLCLREARAAGADEVLMLNRAGCLTEAAVSNVFFVREGVLVTPPLSAGILGGVTRALILQRVAAQAGLQAREEDVHPEQLREFEECFLSSTTRDTAAVEAIDAQRFLVGPTSVTARLQSAFSAYAAEYARQHPELAL